MDSCEYEMVRNKTLLFFFERLMDKGGPRTLHDLSCQFGAKGFTKEMRQIAGGSQSGLKKFLSQYPSLFCINGDFVYVNQFTGQPEGRSSRPNSDAPSRLFCSLLLSSGFLFFMPIGSTCFDLIKSGADLDYFGIKGVGGSKMIILFELF